MKRKASLSTLSYNDPNQGILTYAHDGERPLGIIYNEDKQRISRFDQVPPYGKVLVDGANSEMVIMRLSDGSFLCFKSSSGDMKLKDQLEQGRGQRWCHNYSCIHVMNNGSNGKIFSTKDQNPYNLGRCDANTHSNIRRYVTNRTKPGETGLVKPEHRFQIPLENGGNGKEGIIQFPIKAIHFRAYVTQMAKKILFLKEMIESGSLIKENIPKEIYRLIVVANKELFFIQ